MNLKLKVAPWVGDHATTLEAGDSAVLLCRGIDLDGVEVTGVTATITLGSNPVTGEIQDFISLRVEGAEGLFAGLNSDNVVLGSTPDDFRLIVSGLELEYV